MIRSVKKDSPCDCEKIVLVHARSHAFLRFGVHGEVAVSARVEEDFGVVVGLYVSLAHCLRSEAGAASVTANDIL
jgi:hypothetical protein